MSGLGSFIQGAFQGYKFAEDAKYEKVRRKREEEDYQWTRDNRKRQRDEWARQDEERQVFADAMAGARDDYDRAQTDPLIRNDQIEAYETTAPRAPRTVLEVPKGYDEGQVDPALHSAATKRAAPPTAAATEVSQLADVTLDDMRMIEGYGIGRVDPRLAREVQVPQARTVRPQAMPRPEAPSGNYRFTTPSVEASAPPRPQAASQAPSAPTMDANPAPVLPRDPGVMQGGAGGPRPRSVVPDMMQGGQGNDRLQSAVPDTTDEARAARGFGRSAYLNGIVDAPQLPQGNDAGPQRPNREQPVKDPQRTASDIYIALTEKLMDPALSDNARKAIGVQRDALGIAMKTGQGLDNAVAGGIAIVNQLGNLATYGAGYARSVGNAEAGAKILDVADGITETNRNLANDGFVPDTQEIDRAAAQSALDAANIRRQRGVTEALRPDQVEPNAIAAKEQAALSVDAASDAAQNVTPANETNETAGVAAQGATAAQPVAVSKPKKQSSVRGVSKSPMTEAAKRRAKDSLLDHYYKNQAPKITEFYLKTGQVAKAEAFDKLVKSKQYEGVRDAFAKAGVSALMGDVDGFLDNAAAIHAKIDDDLEVVRGESGIVDMSNGDKGVSLTFRNTKTGETFSQDFASVEEFFQQGMAMISPEGLVDYITNQIAAGQAAATAQQKFNRDFAKDVYMEKLKAILKKGGDQQDLRKWAMDYLGDTDLQFANDTPEVKAQKITDTLRMVTGSTPKQEPAEY